jgi:hypothetical protein
MTLILKGWKGYESGTTTPCSRDVRHRAAETRCGMSEELSGFARGASADREEDARLQNGHLRKGCLVGRRKKHGDERANCR